MLPVSPKPPELNHLLLRNVLLQGRTGQWGKIRRISNIFGNYVSKNCCTSAKKSLWMLFDENKKNKGKELAEAAVATMRTIGRPHPPAATAPSPPTPPVAPTVAMAEAAAPPQQQLLCSVRQSSWDSRDVGLAISAGR